MTTFAKLPSAGLFASNVASAWGFKVVSLIVSLAATAVTVRVFGLETMGILVLAVQISGYALLVEMGIPTSLPRSLPEAVTSGDIEGASRLVSTCFTYLLLAGAGLLVLSPAVSYGLTMGFHIPEQQADFAWLVFAIALALTAVTVPLRLGVGLLYSTHRFSENFLFETLAALLRIVTIFVSFVVLSMHAAYYVVATGGATVLASALALLYGIRYLREIKLRLMLDRAAFLKMVSLGGAAFMGTLAAMTPLQTTSIALAIFVPPGDVMTYTLPAMISVSALSFAAVLSAMISPIASQIQKNDPKKLQDIVLSATRYSLTMSSGILLGIYFFAEEFLLLWLGEQAVAQADLSTMYMVLVTLAAGRAIALVGSPARGALFAMNAHWRTALLEFGFNLAGLGVGLLVGWLTGNFPLAVAVALGAAALVRGQILLLAFIHRSGGRRQSWASDVYMPVAVCAAVIAGYHTVEGLFPASHLVDLLLGAVACMIYALVIFFVVIEKDHKKRVLVWIKRSG